MIEKLIAALGHVADVATILLLMLLATCAVTGILVLVLSGPYLVRGVIVLVATYFAHRLARWCRA